jgi:hypothetical protein
VSRHAAGRGAVGSDRPGSVRPGPVASETPPNTSSHCYWTVLQNATAGHIVITLSGQYADSFEKVGDTWRFTDRLITVDLTGGLSSHVM